MGLEVLLGLLLVLGLVAALRTKRTVAAGCCAVLLSLPVALAALAFWFVASYEACDGYGSMCNYAVDPWATAGAAGLTGAALGLFFGGIALLIGGARHHLSERHGAPHRAATK